MTARRVDSSNSVDDMPQKGMSRRQFLVSVGAAGMVAAGVAAGGSATAKMKSVEPPSHASGAVAMTMAAFEAAIGTRYALRTPQGLRTVTLSRVIDNGSSGKLEQFTVVFEAQESSSQILQDVYELARPGTADKLSLLLSPGEKSGIITAAFCQLKS